MEHMPVVVNFCFREQGLVLPKGNPRKVTGVTDLAQKRLTIVNRAQGTGTRLWFDRKLREAGIAPESIKGYDRDVQRHMDVGLEVLSGRADTGPAIRAVAHLLDMDFLPMHWERFDLLIPRSLFFNKNIQAFLSMLTDAGFTGLADTLAGYDLSKSGKMVYPGGPEKRPA
jgi:molybdate-binding protein